MSNERICSSPPHLYLHMICSLLRFQEALREQTLKLEASASRATSLSTELASLTASLTAAQERSGSAEAAAEELRGELRELRAQLSKAPEPREAPSLVMSDPKLAELVFEATSSREEAMRERHLREQYQEARRK